MGMAESDDGALTGTVIGAYQIGQLVGVGSLAEVYQASHPGYSQPLAIKVFTHGVAGNSAYVSSMRAVAARAQQVGCHNILPVHDFGRDSDRLYLAMPLMRESLRAMLQRAACLPLYRAVPLLRQIAYALAQAHADGIVHRDLKPENVLLDESGAVFVSDFGVGYDLPRASLGTLSSLIGTPAYLAPEQLRGQPTDQRADVYALGVIFYEMLTGNTPFSGATVYEVAAQALTKRIPSPAQRAVGLSPLVERSMLRSLARDPAARWPTVQRFMMGLNASLPAYPGATNPPEPQPARPAAQSDALESLMVDDAPAPDVVDETAVSADDIPTTNVRLHPDPGRSDDLGESSGAIRVPDLRLFRVDPLPPPAERNLTRMMLLGAAVIVMGILVAGGALLVNAAQSARPTVPISTPTVVAPTSFIDGSQVTPISTARPTQAVIPTATHGSIPPKPKPTATATPTPTATATLAPTATL
jgi:serine/threonine protein kinase